MTDLFLPEFDNEMRITRQFLERVPVEQKDWKPHDKSFSLGHLAVHLSAIPSWATATMLRDEMDMQGAPPPAQMTTREALLESFDRHVAEARAAIAGSDDTEYAKPWSLRVGAQVFFTLPKHTVLRNFVMNHNVHHRAQLGVYFRLLDIAVPRTYGPSADEH